jgi:hypothetical protein
VGVALVLAVLWVFGRGHLTPKEAAIRSSSFVWPVVETAVGLAVIGALVAVRRGNHRTPTSRRHSRFRAGAWAATALLACETVFLVSAGAPVFSSSPTVPPPTQSERSLQRAIGTSIVGFGIDPCRRTLGIPFNFNVAYSVKEFAVYDPITPSAYFTSWSAATGHSAHAQSSYSNFCPAVTTVAAARRFGIPFVLEPRGHPGPRGSVLDRRLADENLYRVPGVAVATLTGLSASGQLPAPDAPGQAVPVEHPNPASWRLIVHAKAPQVLRLRLTDVPGWHATIDGRPLALTSFSGVMLQARVPAGRHTVELDYWPDTFTYGIVFAIVGVVALLCSLIFERLRRRGAR